MTAEQAQQLLLAINQMNVSQYEYACFFAILGIIVMILLIIGVVQLF